MPSAYSKSVSRLAQSRATTEPRERPAADQKEVRIARDVRRSRFDRFAEAASQLVSRAAFFTLSLLVILIWMPLIFFFRSVDTWQLVINTLTSVFAFLLIALLQNSERRYDEALHDKIDVLAAALADLMEHQAKPERAQLERHIAELRAAIELEERS
jgi:low affinity Fe/Cu permease